MKYDRIYNFSAGPSMLPLPVLEEVREELFNYRGSGQSVMEMSHRSKVFQGIHDEAKADLRALMGIPENYKILFIQGGATLQFSMIPMNLKKNGVFDYVVSGSWSKKAAEEAGRFGKVNIVANSKDRNYAYVPDVSDLPISEDADYLYICENETIYGTTYQELPNTKGKILISDQSSMFLSKPVNVSDYGIIYGGVQKNVGPAGMAIVIIREDLIREDIDESVPVYLRYHVQDKGDSMYNTPNCWAIYFCGKVFKYLQSIGGLEAV
ncbi:MAG TPA: 3-phosphoserine/phosphohydroxythreonine transaminase, partial [Anaerolineaceae bacterium]|nr:3-phosphoserine/phosphohydroxythreonine transaminase [Anaerolineaceae bacterium]